MSEKKPLFDNITSYEEVPLSMIFQFDNMSKNVRTVDELPFIEGFTVKDFKDIQKRYTEKFDELHNMMYFEKEFNDLFEILEESGLMDDPQSIKDKEYLEKLYHKIFEGLTSFELILKAKIESMKKKG